MKMYVLERCWYGGDFDCLLTEPVFVSSNKGTLHTKKKELSDNMSEIDIELGVTFVINPSTARLL